MSFARIIAARYATGLLLAASLVAVASAARAEEGPFAGLSGAWAGSGTVTMTDGASERIRCHANYSVPPTGMSLNQGLQCASDSYRFDVKANVFAEAGNALRGTWSEATNQVTGNVTGRYEPGLMQTHVTAPAFNAQLSVTTQGAKQTVSIRPEATKVQKVQIEMRRS